MQENNAMTVETIQVSLCPYNSLSKANIESHALSSHHLAFVFALIIRSLNPLNVIVTFASVDR